MVEWWQALLISVPSALLGGLVVGITALVVQHRQLKHESAMQAGRVEAERQGRRDEALREARRERLQPVFALLADIDKRATVLLFERSTDKALATEEMQKLAEKTFPGGLTPERIERFKRLAAERVPGVSNEELYLRAVAMVNRVSDVDLQRDIMAVVQAIENREELPVSIVDIHARLEAEAVGN